MSLLEHAVNMFNKYMADTWSMLTMGLEDFMGGAVWGVMQAINNGLKAGGLALLVVFTFMGIIKSTVSLAELKRPEAAVRVMVRFIFAKALITYGTDFMLYIFNIIQAAVLQIRRYAGGFNKAAVPKEISKALDEPSAIFDPVISILMGAAGLISWLVIVVVSIVILISVYGRFFRLYMYTAISPLMLSSLGGEPTQSIGIGFLKNYAAVCLEGVVITIACIIYIAIAKDPQVTSYDGDWGPLLMVLEYVGTFILYALILLFAVKGADRIAKEMMGQ
ncbi:MAG: hypothetical protein GX663_02720 [Clostridiales bacterium]|nr:hypothetical protein [Clostridiales bacterium]